MDAELARRLALQAGLLDPDLSKNGGMMTDYGESSDSILEFVRLIGEECAKLCEFPTPDMLAACEEPMWDSLACAAAIRRLTAG
jgi:hypothetical protein